MAKTLGTFEKMDEFGRHIFENEAEFDEVVEYKKMFVNVVGKESVSEMKLAEEGEEWEEIVDWFRGDVSASQADLEAKDSKGGSELSEDGADRLVLCFMEAEEVEFDNSGRREESENREGKRERLVAPSARFGHHDTGDLWNFSHP